MCEKEKICESFEPQNKVGNENLEFTKVEIEAKKEESTGGEKKKISFSRLQPEIIVSVGLVVMGLVSIIGFITNLILTGQATGSEIPMAVISGLTGYIGVSRNNPTK